MKNNCVFCAIAAGEIPSFKVYEDDIVLAYLDINPFTKGHVLVIPKEHTEGLLDIQYLLGQRHEHPVCLPRVQQRNQ